jgi:hypothetical protein
MTGGPRRHPCRRVQETLRAARIDYEKVIAAHGHPIPFLRRARGMSCAGRPETRSCQRSSCRMGPSSRTLAPSWRGSRARADSHDAVRAIAWRQKQRRRKRTALSQRTMPESTPHPASTAATAVGSRCALRGLPRSSRSSEATASSMTMLATARRGRAGVATSYWRKSGLSARRLRALHSCSRDPVWTLAVVYDPTAGAARASAGSVRSRRALPVVGAHLAIAPVRSGVPVPGARAKLHVRPRGVDDSRLGCLPRGRRYGPR